MPCPPEPETAAPLATAVNWLKRYGLVLALTIIVAALGLAKPTFLTSSNLINWQTCAMSNQPVLPFTFTDTNPAAGTRFYKVQIGP